MTTVDTYQECAIECFQDDQCEVVGFKEESRNNKDVLCSYFTKLPNQTPIAETNILIDPNTIYFQRFPLKAPYDCSEVMANGFSTSGVYTVYPDWSDSSGIKVYCDMGTDGGGWMIFHRRMDGSGNFDRNWEEFKNGFGDINGEYYLGNDVIHKFTNDRTYNMRIDLADWEGNTTAMNYMTFNLANETDCYKWTSSGYTGEIGDNMAATNGRCFTTKDRDYDIWISGNCAEVYSGWWHSDCFSMNLNGQYLQGGGIPNAQGVVVAAFRGLDYSLKIAEMKIRIHGY